VAMKQDCKQSNSAFMKICRLHNYLSLCCWFEIIIGVGERVGSGQGLSQ